MSGMKSKTVKSVIRKKINEWFESIDDPVIRKMVKENTIVTGGCIPSMLLGEEINDFDVYFRNYETVLKVAEYYVKKFKKNSKSDLKIFVQEDKDLRGKKCVKIMVQSAGVEKENREQKYQYFETRPEEETEDYIDDIFNSGENSGKIIFNPFEAAEKEEFLYNKMKNQETKKNRFRPVFLTTNAITLSDSVQIVLRFYGEPEEIHENYDFVHCTNCWKSWDNELVLNPKALECLLSKTLVYQGSLYPVCSLFRIRKFIKRGWKINAGQILKIALQVSKLDLTDMRVLRDQCVGVDVAYFTQVLDMIESKCTDQESIDSSYLVEVIEEMFGE